MSATQPVEAQTFDEVLPPKDFCEKFPHIPLGTVKWDIHSRHNNGAGEAHCFTKIGKQYFVVIPNYLAWKLTRND